MSLELELPATPAPPPPVAEGAPAHRLPWTRVGLVALAAVAATPYVLALASPLRLDSDSVTYLGLADRIPLGPHHAYPPGYPLLLRLSEYAGLGSAWGFVAVNLVLLGTGVACAFALCRRPLGLDVLQSAVVCVALLLARPILDVTPMLVSDIPYFAAAMLCLLALSRADERAGAARLWRLGLGTALAAVAVAMRIQGVALAAPVALVAIGPSQLSALARRARGRPRTAVALGAVGLATLGVAAVLVIQAAGYAHDIAYVWRGIHGTGQLLTRIGVEARSKLDSVGGLGTHVSGHRVVPQSVNDVAGVIVLTLAALGWRTRRRFGAIEAFVAATATVILVYAGADPRFWIAALPFIVAYVLIAAERLGRSRFARLAATLAATAYVAASVVPIVRSLDLSLAGRTFPERWAHYIESPRLKATYRVAFGEGRPGDSAHVLPAALMELRRYEPLASTGPHARPSRET